MGFRYRKSINLGGGFRINMSKSGIGYSFGGKGYRVTRTARGTTRTTASLPGTGLSYVTESGAGKSNGASQRKNTNAVDDPQVREIKSASVEEINAAEEGDISKALMRAMMINRLSNWLIAIGIILLPVFPPLLLAGIALKIYAYTKGKVNIEYDFEDQQEEIYRRHIQAWTVLAGSRRVWQVITEQSNNNVRKHAGATSTIGRASCEIAKRTPKFINTNADIIELRLSNKEKMYIFPDKLFLFRGKKVATVSNTDATIHFSTVNFIEEQPVPEDARVIDYVWKYTNKNGTPDKRFKDNRELPKCLYGDISIRSASGLNIELQVSSIENSQKFIDLYK